MRGAVLHAPRPEFRDLLIVHAEPPIDLDEVGRRDRRRSARNQDPAEHLVDQSREVRAVVVGVGGRRQIRGRRRDGLGTE